MNISLNHLPVGPYTEEMLAKQWTGVTLSRGVAEGRCNIVELDGENVLEVTHQAGKVGPIDGGVSWRYRFGESYDEYTTEYKVRFADDFDFVKGGKLPGMCGGSSPGGGASTKEADGFSVRVMWREIGTLEDYVYHMDRAREKNWGTDYLWQKSVNKGEEINDSEWKTLNTMDENRIYLVPGKWHTIKTHLKMNIPGKQDGQIASWFDGVEVLNMNLRFRKDTSFGIDSFRFTTFFGGEDASWVPTKNERVYFKDINFLP